MNRVLDIDLDFFLLDTCPFAEEGMRPDGRGREPWREDEVRNYLENNLGLSKARPIPGRVFETHDQALDLWRDLISKGILCAPFHVTHIDAHTDLGIAQKGYPFVRHNVLSKPPENRAQLNIYRELSQLNEANYLSFAVGFRWIKSLENVRNPKSKKDLPPEMLTEDKKCLQLHSAFPMLFEAKYGDEPAIPYSESLDYKTSEPFTCMSLAISPRYSPKEADALIPVFEEYMVKA